jgi:hypothetical protein
MVQLWVYHPQKTLVEVVFALMERNTHASVVMATLSTKVLVQPNNQEDTEGIFPLHSHNLLTDQKKTKT